MSRSIERLPGELLRPRFSAYVSALREDPRSRPWALYYRGVEHLARYSFVAESGLVEGKRVLDIACGVGYGAEMIKEAGAKEVIAADIHFPSLKDSQRAYGKEGLTFIQTDAQELPYPSENFDLVVSMETIEHIEKPALFLGEVQRVLKEGGVFIVSTPNRDISNPGKTLEDRPQNEFHLREYSRLELKELLGGFFPEVEFFGQRFDLGDTSNRWLRKMKFLMRLPRLSKAARVTPLEDHRQPFYFVAMCRKK